MYKMLIGLFLLSLVSCSSRQTDKDTLEYSFFVAGHVYGYPGESEENIGVHPPFKEKLDRIQKDSSIAFGVFTGDMVYNGALEKEWDELDDDIATLGKPVYFAPGNHDIAHSTKRVVFERRYGPSYRSFTHNKDLFILLDPNYDQWNISGDQLTWLQNEIQTKAKTSRNIFVFFHQLLWWSAENEYKGYPPNSPSGRAATINFFTEVHPLFETLENEVVMFAGDTGVYDTGFMYSKNKHITFIASGMGGRKQDNFITTSVNTDGSIHFDLIALNGETTDALGKLEDYQLPQ
jgi:hypothetical protein